MTAITVCVPVYNAALFVTETLQHIAAQEFADFRVVVSVDCSDDNSLELCRAFATDSRFEIIGQPTRLGWVGNVNALIAGVDTPMFCIVPHDDLIDPRYLTVLHDALMRDDRVGCAYSDLEMFGEMRGVIQQPSVRGNKQHRFLDVLLNHYSSVAFRGLVRRHDPNDRPLMPSGLPNDFAADTAWLISLASLGDLLRVPQLLYRKRYLASSVHAAWQKGTRSAQLLAYAHLIACCTRLAISETESAAAREELLVAGWLRACGYGNSPGTGAPCTKPEVAEVSSVYAVLLPPGKPPSIENIIARSEHPVLRDALHTRTSIATEANESVFRWLLRRTVGRFR